MKNKGEIVIYKTEDGKSQLEVQLDNETVWLSQKQIADLFRKDPRTISMHIRNIFKEKELDKKSTISKYESVQREGNRQISRELDHYNLDVIISVGYRVRSRRATQFRIWATQTLKDHLVKGFTINKQRLEQNQKQLQELQSALEFIQSSIGNKQLSGSETSGLLNLITNYTRSFVLLNQYDAQTLETPSLATNVIYEITYLEAADAIGHLKQKLILQKEATDLFGRQRDESFEGLLQSVVQTFGGEFLYPSIEEQAAHLLYFTIKNHPFTDGNKRIGAFLFIWFLQRNKHLLRKNGEAKINDNALVALALLVAESDPANKDLMIRLIINLINNP